MLKSLGFVRHPDKKPAAPLVGVGRCRRRCQLPPSETALGRVLEPLEQVLCLLPYMAARAVYRQFRRLRRSRCFAGGASSYGPARAGPVRLFLRT